MTDRRKEGKDVIIFLTKEEMEEPSKVELSEPEEQSGLILPDGEINWNCPCLGGMATGPCGVEFREAFSCFHYSTSEQKGSECFQQFKTMQECMAKYPTLYPSSRDEDDELGDINPDEIRKEAEDKVNEMDRKATEKNEEPKS